MTTKTEERLNRIKTCRECGTLDKNRNGYWGKSSDWYCSWKCKAKNLPRGPR